VLAKMIELFQVLGSAPGEPPQTAVSADELIQALLDRLVRRMPKSGTKDQPGEVCPYTGLNRSALYELMRKRENGRPVIRTVTLRGENEAHGARFYYVGSVLRYLDRLADKQASEDADDECQIA
jgi:hypothetical protein